MFYSDYFDESIGVLQDRDSPTAIEYAASFLRELLVNMSPSHASWNKENLQLCFLPYYLPLILLYSVFC